MARVTGIRSVALDVTDLATAQAFFTGPMGLEPVGPVKNAVFLRGASRHHHIVELRAGPRRAIRRVEFAADDRPAIDAIHARIAASGLACETPRGLDRPGGGYGFGFSDPEGRSIAVTAEVADHAAPLDHPDAPVKITHVNLNSANRDATARMLIEGLGFRLIDETTVNRFFCCGRDHHSVVVGANGLTTLNHIAFEMKNLDAMMRGGGRMRDAGHPVEWGPGRHGPGDNAFVYFIGPEDLPLEFTAEVLQIDETYVPRGPDDWTWPPGRLDQWGVTDPPTKRWKSVQNLTAFVSDGWMCMGSVPTSS
ncbi:VOC family protein [Nitratireductor soli]|uniref:VOC family protein n=1 Tax=Nitratireductor soli TaxID=1670619 RepID=UPI00065E49C5|nr:VOC family protein [Nitratireductor soli]